MNRFRYKRRNIFSDFKKIRTLKGHVVEFYDALDDGSLYMRVDGGFGATYGLMGTTLIGTFYKDIDDVAEDKNGNRGNTEVFPKWYYPELHKEVEQ